MVVAAYDRLGDPGAAWQARVGGTSEKGSQPPRKLAFTTITDPRNVRSWPGTVHYMAAALAGAGFDVVPIGPLNAPLHNVAKAVSRLQRRAGLRHQSPAHNPYVARQFGRDAARKIRRSCPDFVLALAGSPFAWNCPPDIPLIYVSSATFRLIADCYERYTNLSGAAWRAADQLERRTIRRADLILYPSEWAARSAIEDYGADPSKVKVVPFGANLDDPGDEGPARSDPTGCNLLFVGVDWDRMGGAIALEAVTALRAAGIKAHLTVCGCTPPEPADHQAVTVIPFLDKHDPAARDRLAALYRGADFFILPTRVECYGIVFCEASAYGLPSLASSVGGVPGVVRNGRNGYLMPPDASGTDYAQRIMRVLGDTATYQALRRSTRRAFDTRLNWTVWGEDVADLIADL